MKIDDNLIAYLEELSRLRLNNEEKTRAKEDLGRILDYMDKLNELDTTEEQEVSHLFELTNNFRADEVEQSIDRALILKNAPQKKDGCFKVPKAVE